MLTKLSHHYKDHNAVSTISTVYSLALVALQVALGEPGKQKFIPFTAGGREAWKKGMLKYFPKEEKALDKYLDLLKVKQICPIPKYERFPTVVSVNGTSQCVLPDGIG